MPFFDIFDAMFFFAYALFPVRIAADVVFAPFFIFIFAADDSFEISSQMRSF